MRADLSARAFSTTTKSLADRDVTSNPLEVSAETTQSGKRKASACRLSVCPVIFFTLMLLPAW